MVKEFTFYDYIDADGDGSNVIKNWLNGTGNDAKPFFTDIILHLEKTPPPWITKYTKKMKHEWSKFIELRKTGRINYRLIGKMVYRHIYLVTHAIHKDQHYEAGITPQKALERVSQMISNPTKYAREHEYN